MLLTKDLSLSGFKTSQTAITASRNCRCVVGGLSISWIWIAIFIPDIPVPCVEEHFLGPAKSYCKRFPLPMARGFASAPTGKLVGSWGSQKWIARSCSWSDWRPYHDELHHIAICLLHTSINIYIPFTPANSNPTITVIQFEAGHVREDTVPTVTKVPTRCWRCSLVSLGHWAGLREGYPAFKSRRLMVSDRNSTSNTTIELHS